MKDAEGYDVLRLIEHNRGCYVSSDYVEGTPLIRWLKYHPDLSKEQLFLWIHEMARQLECIHKCRGNPCYRYVNPYSMIITKDKELYFLDISAKANENILSVMQRRNVREHFLPPEEAYYQTESVFLDIYGLGKTIQYLLSESEPTPAFTKREEVRFQNIISRSLNRRSKRAYTNVSELRKQIPIYHMTQKHITKTAILFLAALFITAAAGITMYVKDEPEMIEEVRPEEKKTGEKELSDIDEKDTPGEQNISLMKKELGFLYFLEKKDYEKSGKYFRDDTLDRASQGLAGLTEYMRFEDVSGKEDELYALLEEMERNVPDMMQESYYRCMIEGYRLLDREEAYYAVLRLGEKCMAGADENVRQELTGYMALAYEKTGEPGKAIESYTEMLSWESTGSFREEVYKKLVYLRQENGEPEQAASICRQGVEELEDSVELRLLHIRMQCADDGVEREICAQTIEKYIEEMPELVEEQEFQKLTKEYGITMEGDKIWVGR